MLLVEASVDSQSLAALQRSPSTVDRWLFCFWPIWHCSAAPPGTRYPAIAIAFTASKSKLSPSNFGGDASLHKHSARSCMAGRWPYRCCGRCNLCGLCCLLAQQHRDPAAITQIHTQRAAKATHPCSTQRATAESSFSSSEARLAKAARQHSLESDAAPGSGQHEANTCSYTRLHV